MTTIFKIEKAIKPEWTKEFIEKLRGVKTDIKGFREIIEKELLDEKEHKARVEDESKLLEELEKITNIELGENLVKGEIERVYSEHKENLMGQGIDIKHYLEHLKKDEETYKKEAVEPEAHRRLKAELIMNKLKDIIEVSVDEKEIDDEIKKIMSQYSNPDVVKKLEEKLVPGDSYYEDIKNRMKYRKIIDTFFE